MNLLFRHFAMAVLSALLAGPPVLAEGLLQGRIDRLKPARAVTGTLPGPVQVLGYAVLSPDSVRTPGGLTVRPGERIRLEVWWKLTDRVTTDLQGIIWMGSAVASARLEDESGRHVRQWQIGEVNRQIFDFVVKPQYTREAIPYFFEPAEQPFRIGYIDPAGARPLECRAGVIRVAPEVQVDPGALCLSNNADISLAKRMTGVRKITFPEREPLKGASAGNVYDELTDGIFSGSGNSNWESVFWGAGDRWGADSRRILFELVQPALIQTVVLVSDSPYQNFRVDEMVVEVSEDGVHFLESGRYDNRSRAQERGLLFLTVSGIGRKARFVRLAIGHDASATTLPVSEVFLFGSPVP